VTAETAPPARASAARSIAVGLLLPLVAGAASVLGFAPFHAWPVPIVALALLLHAWQRSGSALQAALSGFVFGLGLFLGGVSWVFVSLHYFGSMPAALAAIATFLFCAYLALFPAMAGWAVGRFTPPGSGRRAAFAAAAFVGFEWLRGWLFSGFPWLTFGTSQAPASPLAGFAPIVGGYGTSLAMAACAALLVAMADARAARRFALLAGIVLIFVAGAGARLVVWTRPSGPAVTVALLQGNVPQQIKWQEEVRTRTLLDYREMIYRAKAQVVVLPETSLPAFLDQLPVDYMESIREHARREGKEILLGTVEREQRPVGQEYFNSLVRITGSGGSYRKRHLVPFGEFIPAGFRWVLAILQIPMSDFSRGAPAQRPLEAAGVRFGVAICYEDIFGEEVIEALPAAQVLVNVSNDAWFGESWAADQHLQASQMRAVETGRWMVRSTNTGASAAIDERGRVVSRLAPFTVGTLVVPVTPYAGATPYSRWGNAPAIVLLSLVILTAGWRPHFPGAG